MVAKSPTGKTIIGTLETLTGVAKIQDVRKRNGRIEFTYSGETDIDWDTQKTVVQDGQRIFVDCDGNQWAEDQIVLTQA